MMSVSIAMATYNGARYLDEQLQSLARQTVLPAELVVTDDISSDETVAILTKFAETAPFPVRIYRNRERLGYRANFMKAAQSCSSEAIAFCDQDDVWMEDKLEHCLSTLSGSGALLVCHNAIVTDSALQEIDTLAKDALPAIYNPPLSVGPMKYGLGFTLVFDRALMAFSPFWEKSIDFNDGASKEGHDQWFFFLSGVFGSILYVDRPLARYRRHTAAATNTVWVGTSLMTRTLPFLFDNQYLWRNYATGFERRADILLEIAESFAPHYAEAATAAAAKYRAFARLYEDRVALYGSPALLKRLAVFSRIWRSHGYRNADIWAKGRKSALKDMLVGVFRLAHLLRYVPAAERIRLRGH
ncbi:MAG TPA: glycosyltransferase [Paraburkholderia sp.]|nr:glycosyltransferase [Paraburkholderia sp.]